jgi:hypothetical protein
MSSLGAQNRTSGRVRGPWWTRDGAVALGVGVLCLALYWPALSPSVVKGDGGEFQMLSYVLGVAHPTGYPLFLLLGWVAAHLPLGGDVAYRLNLLSMFSAAGAMALFYLLLRELDILKSVAALSTLLLASAPRLWMHAGAVEVYPLSVLFILLGSWLLLRWGQGRAPLWAATLVFGLGLTHHISLRLLAPAVLVYLLATDPRLPLKPRLWLPALGTLILPLVLYAYLPLRAAHFLAAPGLQGEIVGVPRAVAAGFVPPHYMAGGMANLVLALDKSRGFLGSRALGMAALPQYLEAARSQYPLLVVAPLALFGLGAMLLRRTRVALYFLLAHVTMLWSALKFLSGVGRDLDHYIPSFVLTILWFAYGADILLRWLNVRWGDSAWKRLVPVLLLACLPAYNIVRHFPEAMAGRQLGVKSEALAILSQPLPEGAVISGQWSDVTPLRYLQRVEGVRPDVWVIQADEPGIADVLLPKALDSDTPFYVLRATKAGLRLLPVPLEDAAAISQPEAVRLGEGVRWRGYDLPVTRVSAGTALPITLFWQADAPVTRNWKVFVHLLDERGERVAQVDRVPLEPIYPPVKWRAGQLLADPYELVLPPDLPPGRYQLIFGGYDEAGRLEWEDGQDFRSLGEIEVLP